MDIRHNKDTQADREFQTLSKSIVTFKKNFLIGLINLKSKFQNEKKVSFSVLLNWRDVHFSHVIP